MKKLILLFTVLAFIGCKEEPKEKVIIDKKDITFVDYVAYLKHDMSLVTGTVKEWHENGQLVFEANFKDGKKVGVHTRWHENGQFPSNPMEKVGTISEQFLSSTLSD